MTTDTRTCRCTRPIVDGICIHCDTCPQAKPGSKGCQNLAHCPGGDHCTDCWERDRRCVICRKVHSTVPAATYCEHQCRKDENRKNA